MIRTVMRTVIFTPAARLEILEQQNWYEGETPGLGRRFRYVVDELVNRISKNPGQFPVIYKEVRRVVLPWFPHSPFFLIDGSPTHWQKRT